MYAFTFIKGNKTPQKKSDKRKQISFKKLGYRSSSRLLLYLFLQTGEWWLLSDDPMRLMTYMLTDALNKVSKDDFQKYCVKLLGIIVI